MNEKFQEFGKYRVIIDAGYLSYMVGVYNQANWGKQKFKPQYRNALFLMDAHPDIRVKVFADYKSRRKEKRKTDEHTRKRHERVRLVRQEMSLDPLIDSLTVPGLEADDTLALVFMYQRFYLKKEPIVIAVDKDLYQIPDMALCMHSASRVRLKKPQFKKLPKFLLAKLSWIGFNGDIEPWPMWLRVWYQAMFGDRSDSIPRILPSFHNGAELILREIFRDIDEENPEGMLVFQKTFEKFGEDFIRNILLIIIPSPLLWFPFVDSRDRELLFNAIVDESYWRDLTGWEDTFDMLLHQLKTGRENTW